MKAGDRNPRPERPPSPSAVLRGPRMAEYTPEMRVVTAAEAVAGIRSGQQLFVHGGAATPSVLLDALVARASELRDVGIIHIHTEGPAPHLAPDVSRASAIGHSSSAEMRRRR